MLTQSIYFINSRLILINKMIISPFKMINCRIINTITITKYNSQMLALIKLIIMMFMMTNCICNSLIVCRIIKKNSSSSSIMMKMINLTITKWNSYSKTIITGNIMLIYIMKKMQTK